MARSKTPKRFYAPDSKYGSKKITRLINYIMQDGKKATAEKITYQAFDLIQDKEVRDPIEVLEEAIEHITPHVEVRARRVGGANLQIPIPVRLERKEQLWMRWLIQAAKARPERTMEQRLAYELIAASKGEGNAVKKRKNMHKSAESHKAYSHLK
ncbi:MAG: 30S ribosomal protein S7 [Bacteroidota bacterium]